MTAIANAIAYLIATPFLAPMHAIERRRLKRNIRAWIAPAIKNGRGSVEWQFVQKWSYRLSSLNA